jgi:lysozyme
MTKLTGILFPDVNHYHPVKDWNAVAATGIPAIGIKVGGDDPDRTYPGHLEGAEKKGLIVIGYWIAVNRDGRQHADDFIDAFAPKEGRIPALDLEHPGDMTPSQREAFRDRIKEVWGRPPLLYANDGVELAGCPKWTSRYRDQVAEDRPLLWQFADGEVGPEPHKWPGIGLCDMNKLIGSLDELEQLAGGGFLMSLNKEQQQEIFDYIHGIVARVGDGDARAASVEVGRNHNFTIGIRMRQNGEKRPDAGAYRQSGWDFADKLLGTSAGAPGSRAPVIPSEPPPAP